MFWGLTPAINFQEALYNENKEEKANLNILVIGGCDARHVLKTIAESYRYPDCFINFSLIDGCPELIARQLLLICMAFEKTHHVGLLEKTRRFLEIYGNILLRPSTSRYVMAKAKSIVNLISDVDYMKMALPFVSIEKTKYRERDYMETLLNFWQTASLNSFDVCKLWDYRLRHTLATRYDSRNGVYDWHYHMRMKEIAKTICFHEYKHFREFGVAFTWLESEVCRPNTTLSGGVYKTGELFNHHGYVGDMVVSPYISFGLSCEDVEMLKESNGLYYKRATDICERNIMRMLYEIENGERFKPDMVTKDTEHNLGMVVVSNIDARLSDASSDPPMQLPNETELHFETEKTKINFLSLSALEIDPEKPENRRIYDLIYVGNNVLNRTKPNVFEMVKEDGLVVFEGRKYLVDFKREQIKDFRNAIYDLATAGNLEPCANYDPENDDFVRFKVTQAKK